MLGVVDVEEEMSALRAAVDGAMGLLQEGAAAKGPETANGG